MKNETALNEYLFDLKLRNCSPRTVRSAKNNMALFLCWLETEYNLTAIEDIKKMNKLLEMLDDDDDVQNTYHNWDE